jgi:hypothetical protein
VPRAEPARYELEQRPAAADQKVRRHAHGGELAEVRVCVRIEPIGKQINNGVATELAGRQRYVVNY